MADLQYEEVIIEYEKEKKPFIEPEWEVFMIEEEEMENYLFLASCVAAGTLITMADGSKCSVEEIKPGDKVLTFDHEAGTYASQEAYIVYKGTCPKPYFTLYFENDTELSIVGGHDLFCREELKYVTVSKENAEKFIGKHFYSVEDKKYLKLIKISYSDNKVDFYSIYTKYSVNSIVNGLLSAPDDVDFSLNFYTFKEDLSIDKEILAKDLEKYGIYKYSESESYSFQEYKEWRGQYINIVIGKGLATMDEMNKKLEEYRSL